MPTGRLGIRFGYNPSTFSPGTQSFYGNLFNDHWVPSPLFCRLVDSLFFHVDEECGPESLRSSGQLEFAKVLTVQSLIAGEAEVSKLPYTFWAALYRTIWDNDGTGYTVTTDADGCQHPVVDRTNWLTNCVRDVQNDPDVEHAAWNKIISTYKLADPSTGLPFPLPIPRTSFPLTGHPHSKAERDRVVDRFLQGLVLEHLPSHTQYTKMVTTSGAVNCDKCGKVIAGTRYKCKECFDFDECDACFYTTPAATSPVSPSTPITPISPGTLTTVHVSSHQFLRKFVPIGSCSCDVCHRKNFNVTNHCLNCRDYDECDDCHQNRNSPPKEHAHLYWHTFVRSYCRAGEFSCDVCGKQNQLVRNHCIFCADYDECEPCRRLKIPQPSAANDPPPFIAPIDPASPPPYSPHPPPMVPIQTQFQPAAQYPAPNPTTSPGSNRTAQLASIAKIVGNVVGLVNFANDNGISF